MTYQPDPEHFRKAATVVMKRGLAQGVYEDSDNGSVCTIGAVSVVYTGDPGGLVEEGLDSPVLCTLANEVDPDYIASPIQTAFDVVSEWSDQEGRTKEEVAELFNRVAARVTTKETVS